jgi:hypothetical protein
MEKFKTMAEMEEAFYNGDIVESYDPLTQDFYISDFNYTPKTNTYEDDQPLPF